ncbi:MAG: AAA family ATPase [Candidatus Peribacteraceae bacterium]|nr:AAA family ATPase [Candidatus Peribacteraceae bacterium]
MKIIDQIIGHSEQIAQLKNDLDTGNIAHAYLFLGPQGIGKMTVARWFAKELLLSGIEESERSRTIDTMQRLIHPDFLVMDKLWIEEDFDDWDEISKYSNVPQEHRSKAPKAKTDTISIDDVRSLQSRLIETSSSKYLCCIIRSVERMQDSAANAFLKILEEPPSRVIFILTASSTSQVLPTIASRTRIMQFHPVSPALLRPLGSSLDGSELDLLLHLSRGAPGRFLTLKNDPDALRAEKQLHSQAAHFWQDSSLLERSQWLLSFTKEESALLEKVLLHIGLALREMNDAEAKARYAPPFAQLIEDLQTNAHKPLIFQRFALALEAK